ncbi:MAG: Arginine--tRNA ligase [Chlamydiae bacterium]|nr:Arginine--tRNA ligase [Chlamydiota bacterium]
MDTVLQLLSHQFEKAILKAFSNLNHSPAIITPATQKAFGHYQCNSAMKIAKLINEKPVSCAEKIIENLEYVLNDEPFIEKAEIKGPGFINIFIDPYFLQNRLKALLEDDKCLVPTPKHKQKVIVEFSSPNVAKQLHVAHLRSSIIGDSIARLFEFLGHEVLRLNHIGDWGTPFGMLIHYLKMYEPDVLAGKKEPKLSVLEEWYKASRKLFDSDETFKKSAQQEVVKLQAKDPISIKAWEVICDISRKAFEHIYKLLDIKIQARGESFYNPFLPFVIETAKKKHLLEESNGANVIFLEGFKTQEGTPLPIILQKADGGFNYSTTDVAAFWHRAQEEKADRIIVVTDNGQALHFQMAEQAAEKLGFIDPQVTEFNHVTFGLVLGEDGKKIKTRSGQTFKLIDFLEDAVEEAHKILKERYPEENLQEILHLAQILGIDAVKYCDLACLRTKDYTFSYERMLRFEGNTAAFLLYSYVRSLSIQRKAKSSDISLDVLKLSHPSEIELAVHLLQFPDVLLQTTRDLFPNRIADFCYHLAEKFNAFFRDCHVIGDPNQDSRLLLCQAVQKTFESALWILGLKTVEKM